MSKEVRFIAGMLVMPMLAWGWGEGHDTVGRALAARLPGPWCERLHGATLEQFCKDSHYPDERTAFSINPRVTSEEVAYLARFEMKDSGSFHSDEGRAVAFCLMVRALREHRTNSALLWLACLSHSTADMAACNHDPAVHIVTYGWGDPAWGLKIVQGDKEEIRSMPLDLGWVEHSPETEAVWDDCLSRIRVPDKNGSEKPADVLLGILLDGFRGAEICAPRGMGILQNAAAWAVTKSPANEKALAENLSALGVWAIERLLNDFAAAQRFASGNEFPDLTRAIRKQYEEALAGLTVSRKYGEDSFTKGLTTPLRSDAPYVGVVSEPTWRMDIGMFGFNDRLLAAQAVASLREKGTNVALIDVRKVQAGSIDVSQVPVLLVFAQCVRSFYKLNSEQLWMRLKAYRQAGGKIVWIGGSLPDRSLCDFPAKVATRINIDPSNKYVWCWTRLPVGTNAYSMLTLRIRERPPRELTHTPNFKLGWQSPNNTTVFHSEAVSFVSPLATLYDGKRPILVGAAWPKDCPTLAYLPTYAVFPYFWTSETPSLFPLKLGLDSQGKEALETALAAVHVRQ